MRKRQVPAPNPRTVARATIRQATLGDLDLLVRHRRGMWNAIAKILKTDLDVADRTYRRWARTQMKSDRFAGFIVDVGGAAVASGCVWFIQVQPRPNWKGTTAAYLLSMFTKEAHRGRGHGARIVREAIRFAKARGIPVMLLHASAFGEPITRVSVSSERRRCACSWNPENVAVDAFAPPGKRRDAGDDDPLRESTQAFKYDLDL